MPETLVALLAAHLLGEFILQAEGLMKHRRNLATLLFHAAFVTIAACVLAGSLNWLLLLLVLILHFVMNIVEAFLLPDSLAPFLLDRAVHFFALLALAYCFSPAAANGWWTAALPTEPLNWYFAGLSLLSGLILTIPLGGELIGKATRPFFEEIRDNNIEGLKKGGKYIGWLERFLVLLLLLINQPTGIGFLIAAKSILRFGEIKDASQRKVAEYIIIGTFFSFGWALLISVLTQQAINHWLPFSPSPADMP